MITDQRKFLMKKKIILIIGAIFLTTALLVPTAMAFRRNHRYHAYSAKPRVTPSPLVTLMTPLPLSSEITDDLIKGQWDYLAGATHMEQGLVIHGLDSSIVSQDGTDSIPNPPINLAGTYLGDIKGNFSIAANMQIPAGTTATIQLYSNPPIIADEFRVEQPSIQIVIAGKQLQVRSWNDKSQTPTTLKFSIPEDPNQQLQLIRDGDNLKITLNEIAVGTIKTPSLLTSGKLWFGFDSAGGDWTLSSLKAQELVGGTFHIADGSILQIANHNPQGLQLLAEKMRPGFLIGMALALGPAVSDTAYNSVAFDNAMFGSITPENETKMINLQPQQGVYTFQKADALINLAKQNGINDIHGHALVFGEANPMWFNRLPVRTAADKQSVEEVMIDHITTVVTHFGEQVASWDVINEPIADYDEFEAGETMRNHKWYQAMGDDYIIKAFKAAYSANPNAIYSINEYGLEEDGERWEAFLELMTQLKSDLEDENIPLDKISVGFQSHVYESGDKINPTVLRKHIRILGGLGFKSQISENDVYSDDGTNIQSQQYSAILNACISEPSCIAWRGWILTDKYDLFEDDGQVEYGQDGLFGKTMKPRPALGAMQQILK